LLRFGWYIHKPDPPFALWSDNANLPRSNGFFRYPEIQSLAPKNIYEYTRSDVPDSFAVPPKLFDFFVRQVDKYAGASDATLSRNQHQKISRPSTSSLRIYARSLRPFEPFVLRIVAPDI
jgi:hypothetical protein